VKLAETAPGQVAREGTYIDFVRIDIDPKRITPRFGVVTKLNGRDTLDTLGMVKWHGAWRCYSFFPESDTLYERKCLMEIAQFLTDLMEERKR
jgi:hypothetical protein